VYLTPEAVEHLVLAFAQGEGEGYAIVNFLNPFEPEKTDAMKRILLKHLDFVGSRAARHRKMSDKEQKNYADYGDWALLEIWTLRRRNRAPTSMLVKSPETQADLTAQKLPETDGKPNATSRALSYRPVPKAGAIKQALVTAASRLSSLDSQSGPKCLIRLGDLPVICHVISQLSHSGIERAVILCGYQGKQIQQAVERNLSSQFREKIKLEFIQLGDAWQKGHAQSILEAKQSFKAGEEFLLCMSDHLFDPALISKMSSVSFAKKNDSDVPNEAYCLIEADTDSLVGLSSTAVKVLLDKTDMTNVKVKSISRTIELKDAHGIEAGLFVCNMSLFDKLELLATERAYYALAEVMELYAADDALWPVETDQRMWFSLETKETLAYAVSDGLKEIGVVHEDKDWLSEGAFSPDGKPIKIWPMGHGKKQVSPTGSSWSEFTVERWRSAVYINLSYFGDLYTETCNFVTDIAKHMKLRGERVSLCEVGCGTGEFIRPLVDQFRTVIGMDFNQNFIQFCNEHIPAGYEHKMRYICGDACELVDLMKRKAPPQFQNDTKIVCCVGNTMGIIPVEMKRKVYKQMAELAGPNGVMVIVYWNSKCFGDACQNFYHANPQLCGAFTGECIDFDTTTITTGPPACYRSHWTGIEEARKIIADLGMEEIVVEEKGKGVLVAARQNVHTPRSSPALDPSAPGGFAPPMRV